MKKTLVIMFLFSLIFLSACSPKTKTPSTTQTDEFGSSCSLNATGASDCNTTTGKLFSITSPAFKNKSSIPSKYSCNGKNINPPFEILNAPKGAQSFAMIVYDPDASAGDWIHWIVRNFSPNITKIEEGKSPLGAIVGKNSRGKAEYSGPCPPNGTHKYFFKLYALDTNYGDLQDKMTLKQFEEITQSHTLGTTQFYGTYSK